MNRGFASGVSKKCLEYGFIDLGLKEIFIHTYFRNIPSMRVAEKIGMKKRKGYNKEINQLKHVMRHVVYSLKRKDFANKWIDQVSQ